LFQTICSHFNWTGQIRILDDGYDKLAVLMSFLIAHCYAFTVSKRFHIYGVFMTIHYSDQWIVWNPIPAVEREWVLGVHCPGSTGACRIVLVGEGCSFLRARKMQHEGIFFMSSLLPLPCIYPEVIVVCASAVGVYQVLYCSICLG
jgi:hypothetical protein